MTEGQILVKSFCFFLVCAVCFGEKWRSLGTVSAVGDKIRTIFDNAKGWSRVDE